MKRLLVALIILWIVLTACGGGSGGLVGTWEGDNVEALTYTFASDGSVLVDTGTFTYRGVYAATDGQLCLTYTESLFEGRSFAMDQSEECHHYEIDGDSLTITFEGLGESGKDVQTILKRVE